MEHEALTRQIIGGAIRVHRALGPGFLESVYERALTQELRATGVAVACGRRIRVLYKGVIVGDFFADMLVCERILIEIKAVQAIVHAHEAQLVNYLTATRIEIGLLLNFGSERLQFKRKTRTYRNRTDGQDAQDRQDGRPSLRPAVSL